MNLDKHQQYALRETSKLFGWLSLGFIAAAIWVALLCYAPMLSFVYILTVVLICILASAFMEHVRYSKTAEKLSKDEK